MLRLVALRIRSLGIARFRHQQPHGRKAGECDRRQSGECRRAAEVIADVTGERGAHRGANADEGADDALSEVEVAGAARQSATTSGTMTLNTAAVTPSSSCTTTSNSGFVTDAKRRPRIGSAAKPISSSGRRPQICARRPTQGDKAATTSCGTWFALLVFGRRFDLVAGQFERDPTAGLARRRKMQRRPPDAALAEGSARNKGSGFFRIMGG